MFVVLQQLDAAMKRLPYGFLWSLGNQWKYGNERWAVTKSIPYLLQKSTCDLNNAIHRHRAYFVCGITFRFITTWAYT